MKEDGIIQARHTHVQDDALDERELVCLKPFSHLKYSDYRRIRGYMIETHKILTGIYDMVWQYRI